MDPQPIAPRCWEVHGEPMAYFVRSRSNPRDVHRVELLEHGGAGECSCPDWQARRWVAIRAGQEYGRPATVCFHVNEARIHFLNKLLATMAAQQNPSP